MSFKSRDLMIDVLPSGRFDALVPGLVLCGQVTATGKDEGEDEDDDLQCGQVTAVTGGNEPTSVARTETDLALLRRQLCAALSA